MWCRCVSWYCAFKKKNRWGRGSATPREPAPWLIPIGIPVRRVPTKEGGIGTSTGQKTRHRCLRPKPRPKTGTNTPSTPLEPPKPSNPDPQPRHAVHRLKKPPTPNKKEPAGSAHSDDQDCDPTPKKRADRPAQCNQNTPHRGGHMTNMPNHPEPMVQSQQSAQSPMPGTGR
ncbi:hypothetical protein ATANTOWER_012549 [Ataeniobius toweri]|uniref:Uncharacterized protein n=1 Tax=Ataeniobius toweri TaxID=208326 RepID=A0ABU7AZT9_9TELE|nr:hypothetical protein [Ataeniobius toweri]